MPKAQTKTEQVTKNELPPWVSAAGEANYNEALQLANRPYEQFSGPLVAPTSEGTKLADKFFTGGIGPSDNVAKASNLFSDAAGRFQNAGVLADTDLSPYLSPYIDQVENRALDNLSRQRDIELSSNAEAAAKSHAFGGSRHGIIDAVTRAETARSAGDLSATLRAGAYDNAVTRAQQDINNRFNAAGGVLSAGGGVLSADEAIQAKRLQDFAGLSDIGAREQGQTQAEIDAEYAKFLEERNYPIEGLNLRLSALGLTPYNTTQSTTGTQSTSPNPFTTGLGVLSAVGGFFSDRRDKTDIKKLGKDPATGIDIYAYRYKDDPKSYPKVVGPMAQDVAKVMPEAVTNVDGRLVINA